MAYVEVMRRPGYAGTVMGDHHRPTPRHGAGMDDMVGGGKAIKAEVPLSRCSATPRAAALDDAGPRHVHDGVQALRRGSAQRSHHRRTRRSSNLACRTKTRAACFQLSALYYKNWLLCQSSKR